MLVPISDERMGRLCLFARHHGISVGEALDHIVACCFDASTPADRAPLPRHIDRLLYENLRLDDK